MSNAFLRRTKLVVVDALKHSRTVREAAGWGYLWRGLLNANPTVRGAHLARALGFASSARLAALASARLRAKPGIDGQSEVWREIVQPLPRYRDLLKSRPHLDRSIILKAPGDNGEKGVLLMTFEYNWARLLLGLTDEEFRWLDERYDLVLSTSWSPTDYAALALALSRVQGTVFVQSCNYGEIAVIEGLHPRVKCLPTLPCDWINSALYEPKPAGERTTDIVMVANWGEFKRHWDLFRALAQMPASLRVVLIGQAEGGRSIETLRGIARDFGAPQDLQFVESIPISEVARHQCNAKVSLIMTRREGCCVAAVESLFAGCALAMREDAHVGPLAYINEHTGRRLRTGHLAEDLMTLIGESPQLQPRTWANEHVAGTCSYQKVNALFREHAVSLGRPWTQDLVLPQWRPHPTFARTEDQECLRPTYEDLHQRFPQVFSAQLLTESWR